MTESQVTNNKLSNWHGGAALPMLKASNQPDKPTKTTKIHHIWYSSFNLFNDVQPDEKRCFCRPSSWSQQTTKKDKKLVTVIPIAQNSSRVSCVDPLYVSMAHKEKFSLRRSRS
jgi:hypothetical protein